LARLDTAAEEVARWGPVLPLAALAVLALAQAVILPRPIWAKGVWVLAVLLCGAAAAVLLQWQERMSAAAAADHASAETEALQGLWAQWDRLAKTLPPPQSDLPKENFDSIDDALASLSAKVGSIEGQIDALKAGKKGRAIDDDTAAKLSDYLRQYGDYRVIVSCSPSDLEAYTYANRLVNILRAAGWDANGPQTTAYPDEGTGMGINLYVRDPASPAAAKILIDAFSRFNIPYQSAIAENDAIPDIGTVELFVARKP
jgi:hypothetical protein